ncbi:Di-sulfide bridge nucleocytoplasmic transport domain-containing protein [Staphylotrichum tortipilum]|uniref:Di-sulfide bridge nucleocytoplasmic transport domain-containing protein n=1 Tax=Staphylotrichum tortipilum TaxID=2831512 RepID=A0AAN6MBV2_9PEZI|nr:Di-sulfide bridge nucleocytoplasmic transport domain-containing protein [Staphylotrichum longicolle]
MDRRTYEGPMDWEYQSQPPVDHSSPFAKFSKQATSTFNSPSKLRSTNPNPFAFGDAPKSSPLKPQGQPRPPHASFFNPELQRKPTAPAFRNPAFTTPQKRVDELLYSELSGAESSPALTDASPMPAETPDEREEQDVSKLTMTPSAGRTLFSKTVLRNHASGRGEIARGSRDKVRKRKRQQGDRDVGSVRPRLPHDSDDSDSDWPEGSGSGTKRGKDKRATKAGWFKNFLSAVSDHPSAPAILSKWLQLAVNVILLSTLLICVFAILTQMRSDLAHANEKARAAIINEMSICAENFQKNACSPRAKRAPALDGPCNEWDACMKRDPYAEGMIISSLAKLAEMMNEFVGILTFKTWGFIVSLFLAAIIASNVGFGFLRESTFAPPPQPAAPLHSAPALAPMLGSAAAHHPQTAYIFAPINQTPRHVRKTLFANDATDSEASPDMKMIMPPQTPSGRRSPSKGDRDRGRSPSKGYSHVFSSSPSKRY